MKSEEKQFLGCSWALTISSFTSFTEILAVSIHNLTLCIATIVQGTTTLIIAMQQLVEAGFETHYYNNKCQ